MIQNCIIRSMIIERMIQYNRTTRIENYSTKFCTYSIPTRDVEIMGFVGSKHELYKGGALNG